MRKKFPEFSRLFQSHNYTFPEVIATKCIRNNDLHISMVILYLLLLMWLTRACHHILLKSTVFMHQIHLDAYRLLDTGCSVPECKVSFPRGCTKIPWEFHDQRNPRVFQVFQVCGHPVNTCTASTSQSIWLVVWWNHSLKRQFGSVVNSTGHINKITPSSKVGTERGKCLQICRLGM